MDKLNFRGDLKLTLKSSCDACTQSKVKCSGTDPCERCVKKGISCFYSPKKKRGPVKRRERSGLVQNQPMVVKSSIVGANASLNSLGSWERRSWSVFFTLYKHYAVSCSLFWFNRQLHKMRMYLVKQKREDALKRLTSWMNALNIDPDELAGKLNACSLKLRQWGKEAAAAQEEFLVKQEPRREVSFGESDTPEILNRGNPFHLRVNGAVSEDLAIPTYDEIERSNNGNANSSSSSTTSARRIESYGTKFYDEMSSNPGVASVHVKIDYKDPTSDSEIRTNQAFHDLFGYDGTVITEDLSETGGGFLPWSGDILSRILTSEEDLLAFVQILAIKFNTMGKPKTYPIVREVPSVHVFDINWKGYQSSGPISSAIKCVHKEVISDTVSFLEVYMTFQPMQDIPKTSHFLTDRDLVTIEDAVELPPKRLRREEELPDPNSVIYNYQGIQEELRQTAVPGSSLVRQPFQSSGHSNMSSESIINGEPAATLQNQLSMDSLVDFDIPPLPPSNNIHVMDTHIQQPPPPQQPQQYQQQYSEQQPKQKMAINASDGESSGVGSPSQLGEEDIFDSLPFDEESSSTLQYGDDGEWLDELLKWTGPIHPLPNLSG